MNHNLPRKTSAHDLQAEARRRGLPHDGVLLVVDIERQVLVCLDVQGNRRQYPVSTAARGRANRRDSLGTPPGWHRVAERFGLNAPPGTEFASREATGRILGQEHWMDDGEHDAILTRILWLDGLEDGINRGGEVDSHERYIYIHGTNHEQHLGSPASRGCVRMANLDIIALADDIANHETWVWIGSLPAR